MATASQEGKILILATESCAYPGADSVGQAHSGYPTNAYILRVRAPVLFPERFYMDCFRKGIGKVRVGETLEIYSNDPGTRTDIPIWAKKVGHEYLGLLEVDGYDKHYVRRNK